MPTENDYKRKLVKAILHKGVYAYPPTDRFHHGVPDIYWAGGNWIECKIAPISKTRYYNVMNLLTDPQKRNLDKLTASGDRCFVCVFWIVKDAKENWCTITYWPHFKQITHWKMSDVVELGLPMKEGFPINMVAIYLDRNIDLHFPEADFRRWYSKDPQNWNPAGEYHEYG